MSFNFKSVSRFCWDRPRVSLCLREGLCVVTAIRHSLSLPCLVEHVFPLAPAKAISAHAPLAPLRQPVRRMAEPTIVIQRPPANKPFSWTISQWPFRQQQVKRLWRPPLLVSHPSSAGDRTKEKIAVGGVLCLLWFSSSHSCHPSFFQVLCDGW